MYEVKSVPKFKRTFKKFLVKEQGTIKNAICKIMRNPLIGVPKKGPLKGIRVFKFQIKKNLMLLSYKPYHKKKIVIIYAIRSHENYYTKLAKTVK